MRKMLNKAAIMLSVVALTLSAGTIKVHADSVTLKSKNGDIPKMSELTPIKIEMETTGDLSELSPGSARDLIYKPAVRGHEKKKFTSKATLKVTTSYESPYELYRSKDVTYTYQEGYKIKPGAKPLAVESRYMQDGKDVVEYKPIINQHVIKGLTELKGLEFTLVAPHQERRLPEVRVDMVVEVSYDDLYLPYEPGEHIPEVDIPNAGDETITGEGYPGDEIIVTDKDGNVIGKGEVDENGNFEVELDRPVEEGEIITVTPETEGQDKPSPEVEAEVDKDHTPSVDTPIDGDDTITGEGVPGDEIVVTDKDGNIIGKGEVDEDGNFEVELDKPLEEGDKVVITPHIPGRDKPGKEVEVEVEKNHTPEVDEAVRGDETLTGKGNPGDKIIVEDSDGDIIGEGIVDKDGNFVIELDRPLLKDEEITAYPEHKPEQKDKIIVGENHKPIIETPVDGDETIIGEGIPGDEIVVTDKDGNVIGKGEVDEDGNFEVELDRPIEEGETIIVTPNTDGKEKPGIEVEVQPEHTPKVDRPGDGDREVTGKGYPGDEIVVTDQDGNVIGKGTVDKDGNFKVELDRPLHEGEVVNVNPKYDGGEGPSVDIEVEKTHKPKVDEIVDGDETITGEGYPGDEIIVTDKDGNVIGKGEVDKNGNFEIDLDRPVDKGETITVTPNTDGRERPSTEVEVGDSHKPQVNIPKEGDTEITGKGKPGDEITVTDKNGNVIGKGEVDKDGNFKVELDRPLEKGEEITITPSRDGKDYDSTTITVEGSNTPIINQPHEGDKVITGTGKPGDVIVIRDADGNELGRGTVGLTGKFKIKLTRRLYADELISATPYTNGEEGVPSFIQVARSTDSGKETGDNSKSFQAVVGVLGLSLLGFILLRNKDEDEDNIEDEE